eukprot:EC714031.1.p1 GENE.EC714031.1~~EC714031.1.p1  ORF type:complete len:61 (-),score=0.28 EC714031.1:240-422(-)
MVRSRGIVRCVRGPRRCCSVAGAREQLFGMVTITRAVLDERQVNVRDYGRLQTPCIDSPV